MKRAWGFTAVALGVWEAAALCGRFPTVTVTVARCHVRRRRTTRALVALWLLGLGKHLLEASA